MTSTIDLDEVGGSDLDGRRNKTHWRAVEVQARTPEGLGSLAEDPCWPGRPWRGPVWP